MKTGAKWLLALLIVASLVVTVGCRERQASGSAQRPLVLRLGTAHADGQPSVEAAKKLAADVREKTGGRIVIEIFPGGILGNEVGMRDMVATGSLQMASLGAGVMGPYVGAANLPVANYVWRDEEHMLDVLNGELGKQFIYDPVEQVSGIHVINGWPQPARRLLTVRPVRSLADLRGMKIRVPANEHEHQQNPE